MGRCKRSCLTGIACLASTGVSATQAPADAAAFVSAAAAARCGVAGYSEVWLIDVRPSYGVAATITSLTAPSVQSGHVAGWIGLGGYGAGPGGSTEWIQAGLNSSGGESQFVYYEVAQPHQKSYYVNVVSVSVGSSHRVAVFEMARRRNWWRAWLDGKPMSPPIHLSESHGRWAADTVGESWDGGQPACNRYRYRFSNVAVAGAAGGSWQPFRPRQRSQDPGYFIRARAGVIDAGVAD